MWLTRLAITRPVTILMLVLALVIMGLQSRSRLPVDLYPNVELPMLLVSTVYPGTGPEEVETLITKPIEDAVSSISGLKKLTSTSQEGVSSIRMEFEIGTNLDEVTADVRSKVDILRSTLPQDARAPQVIKVDFGSMPVLSLSISSKTRSSIEVRRMADDIIKDRLSQLPGVASVSVTGGDVREVRVEVNKERLEAYGLTITQVVNALKAENLNLPSGTVDEDSRTAAVRVMGEFTAPDQILNVRIANAVGNPNLTIRDVATVTDTVAKPTGYTRVDRGQSVALTVQKQSDGNTVKVVDAIREELERLTGQPFTEAHEAMVKKGQSVTLPAGSLPGDMTVTVAMDQSTFIRDTLHDVYQSLIEGALLAVLIVFLFLHSTRGTFIVALAIPTSMIATFLVMDALGFTINMMSMMGLSLAVGILVDDSIVVIENIHRHLAMGESPQEAAINGRNEIGLAAVTITMVDVVVFVPIAFMGGIVGQMFRQFGITVAVATLFSLFISFTLTPMLASRWLKPHNQEEEEERRQAEHPGAFRRFVNTWEAFYTRVERLYRGILDWALEHRAAVISLGLMTMLASFATAMKKPSIDELLSALPVLAVAVVGLFLLWSLVSATRGGGRIVAVVGGLLVSLFGIFFAVSLAAGGAQAFVALKGGFKGVATFAFDHAQMFSMLMLIALFGVIGLTLSIKPRGAKDALALPSEGGALARAQTGAGAVFAPITLWYAVLCLICLFYPGKFGYEFSPKVDRRQFSVKIEHEVGTSLAVTNKTAEMVENALFDMKEFKETKTVFAKVGNVSGGSVFTGGSSGADSANFDVELQDIPQSDKMLARFRLKRLDVRSTDQVIKDFNERFKNVPGVKITASVASDMGGGGAPIRIEVSGPDESRSLLVANKILDIVKGTPGTYGCELSWRQGRPEMQAIIDRDRAAQYGISVAQIAAALRTSLEGDTTTKYRENGKEYDIRVSLPEGQRDRTAMVPSLVVGSTTTGRPVYLSDVVRLAPAVGPTKVERSNRQRAVTVNGYLLEGHSLGNVQSSINAAIAQIPAQERAGVTVTWAGQAEMMADSGKNMAAALVLSVVLVFMLMAALFESVLSPLIIMMAVPQAMAGALFALTFTGSSLSIVTMIGIIMLVGLVTKNAILMVDYTNTLRKEGGLSRREALRQAGPTRLRPILMTTLAMIFGMMPTAIALSNGAEMRQPMAIAVIGGLILSMLLTLLMVPVFYEMIDDIGAAFARLKDRIITITRA